MMRHVDLRITNQQEIIRGSDSCENERCLRRGDVGEVGFGPGCSSVCRKGLAQTSLVGTHQHPQTAIPKFDNFGFHGPGFRYENFVAELPALAVIVTIGTACMQDSLFGRRNDF